MFKKVSLILLLFAPSLLAQNQAYLKRQGDEVLLGNSYIEREISVSPHNVGTTEIINKMTGTVYKVNDDVFAVQIVFSGLGPAPLETQNGENEAILTAKDFDYEGFRTRNLEGGGKELTLNFNFKWEDTDFNLEVHYEVFAARFSMRKWIEVSDSSYGMQFLNRIYVESLTFKRADFSHGQFGQPVFNNNIFMGVEYPTAVNQIKGDSVRIGYVVGQEIKKKPFISHTAILGSSSSKTKLALAFMKYVDGIAVNGIHPFLLYNTWYDMRTPAMADGPAGVENETNVLRTIDSFKKNLFDKYGIALNGFVLDGDAGWNNANSIWAIDSSRFPDGFTRIVRSLDSMHTSLGLWASPFGGYPPIRDSVVAWAKKHGYETTGDFLCLSGPKYKAKFMQRMDEYTRQYRIGYFKWDGLLLSSNEPNQGYLPGIYSGGENTAALLQIAKSVRKINPDIFLNMTTGTWLSPWWLKYANCIWMQGSDYGYLESVPSIDDRDKAITYKDAVLWNDFRKQNLLFPMWALMTHGIIRGRYNLLGGAKESLASFSNEVMMYFGRGVMMWELYVTPDLLSTGEWNAIASAVKWAKSNQHVLEHTRMILGDPARRQVYGYIHMTKSKGILLLRNPGPVDKKVKFSLSQKLGEFSRKTEYYVKIVYPYNFIFPKPVKMGEALSFDLNGYEVLTAELIPQKDMDKSLPVGVRYSVEGGHLMLFGSHGERKNVRSVGKKPLGVVQFGRPMKRPSYKVEPGTTSISNEFNKRIDVNVPSDYTKAKLALLLQFPKRLGKNESPDFAVSINGARTATKVVQGDGAWFWVISKLYEGGNSVDCSIRFKGKPEGKVSLWLIGREGLVGKKMEGVTIHEERSLPAKPYPASMRAVMTPISQYDFH